MDAYYGYHKIPIGSEDEVNIAFVINNGTFYYRVMLFGLKNAIAMYQMMVTKVFKGLIGRNMEAYIDNMLVKNLSFEQHLKDLK